MTEDYIKSVDRVIQRENKMEYVRGQFHLGLYFILHCEEFLEKGDFFGIVIPESILQNVASHKIIDFILNRFQIYALISSNAQIAFSENTDWKEILLVLVRSSDSNRGPVRFVTLYDELTYENAKEFAIHVAEGRVPSGYDKKISIEMVNQGELARERNWIRILRKDVAIDELMNIARNMLKTGKEVWG